MFSSLVNRVSEMFAGYVARVQAEVESFLPEREEEGQGMIEYGLIIALISIAAIALLILFKDPLVNLFSNALSGLKA
jgi:pilus assembly protein Flp/PilA